MSAETQQERDIQALIELLQTEKSLKVFRETFPSEEDLFTFAGKVSRVVNYDLSGYRVVKQGELGHDFFIVMSGQLRAIDVTNPDKPQLLGYLTSGAFGGARALLSDRRRMATVEVVTRAKVAFFDESTWDWLLNRNPRFRVLFENLEDNRMKQSSMDFPGRQFDEVVVIATKRHFVAFIATLPLPLTLLIAPILFFLAAELLSIELLTLITDILTLIALLPLCHCRHPAHALQLF